VVGTPRVHQLDLKGREDRELEGVLAGKHFYFIDAQGLARDWPLSEETARVVRLPKRPAHFPAVAHEPFLVDEANTVWNLGNGSPRRVGAFAQPCEAFEISPGGATGLCLGKDVLELKEFETDAAMFVKASNGPMTLLSERGGLAEIAVADGPRVRVIHNDLPRAPAELAEWLKAHLVRVRMPTPATAP
jgi:hypothetical protein